jgi:hypothetical protein
MFKTQKAHFFWLWFPIVSICVYLGILLSRPLGEFLYNHNGMSYSVSNDGLLEEVLSLLLLVGLFMGFGQWIVINTRIKQTYGWILATLIGLGFGSIASFLLFGLLSSMVDQYPAFESILLIGVTAGAGMFTGFCQWVSLKGETADFHKWSLVMALSLVVGMALLFLVTFIPLAVVTMLSSIAIGLISGAFAESLLIQSEIQ